MSQVEMTVRIELTSKEAHALQRLLLGTGDVNDHQTCTKILRQMTKVMNEHELPRQLPERLR